MSFYEQYRALGTCIDHSELIVGDFYRFIHYGDTYIGCLVARSDDYEDVMFSITKCVSEDCAYSVGSTMQVYDINVKERIARRPVGGTHV